MKINGIEIERLNTTELLKNLKTFTVLIPFYFIFGAFFGIAGVGLLFNPMEEMWIVPIMGIVGCIAFLTAGVQFIKKAKYIKKVLATRTITEEERESADNSLKKLLIACIAIIVIVPIIIFAIVGGSIDNHSGSSGNGRDKCRNCGRETNLVAGYGYCYDCYEGFVDWQEDNWTEED